MKKNSSEDITAVSRKQDHIQLAFESQVGHHQLDQRFDYEPILAAHPEKSQSMPIAFLNKKLGLPLWVSSMTGGTEKAKRINENLAKACKEFGMGMGLGSCRQLLYSDEYFHDFNIRPLIGDDLPLYANLGIAQIEKLLKEGKEQLAVEMVQKLKADGLIIHVNPLQEWMQPEGDVFEKSPLETIKFFLDKTGLSVIVKEVGQGMGYESLKALFQLPIEAIEFGAGGGTNFAKLELLRADENTRNTFSPLTFVGHTAEEMTLMCNQILQELGEKALCKEVIISGGIRDFLDGYYLIEKANFSAVYAQASAFLKHSMGDYEDLKKYVEEQSKGLAVARAFLRVKG